MTYNHTTAAAREANRALNYLITAMGQPGNDAQLAAAEFVLKLAVQHITDAREQIAAKKTVINAAPKFAPSGALEVI